MQGFFSKYGLAAHLALLAAAPLVLFAVSPAQSCGGALLWLALLALAWTFLEPSRRPGEMLHDSRARTIRFLSTDPAVWLFAVIAAYAAVRWANGAVVLGYSPEKAVWGLEGAPVEWLPSAAPGVGFEAFCGAVAAFALAAGCRNALGRQARAAFLAFAACIAGAAAVATVFAAGVRDSALYSLAFAKTGGFPPAGIAFGLFALAGMAAVCLAFTFGWRAAMLPCSIAAGACAAAQFVFAPLAASCVFVAAYAALALCLTAAVWLKSGKIDALKYIAFFILAAMVAGFLCWRIAPAEAVGAKINLALAGVLPDGVLELRARLAEIAAAVWRDNVWMGSGAGTFALDARMAATPADWAAWGEQVPASALNGWRQLLAERGVAGVALFALPPCFFLFTFARRLAGARARFACFPLAALAFAAAAAVAVWTLAGCELASPAVFVPLCAILALAPFAFPAPRAKDDGDGGEKTAS